MKSDGVTFIPLDVVAKDVAARIAVVRAQMRDPTDDQALVGALFSLYGALFAPVEAHLKGVAHVIVVPNGPLQSLPFGMLVAAAPPQIRNDSDFRAVHWLAKQYAFSVLPSVSSIRALRFFAKDSRARQPFIGFGDPVIGEGSSGTPRNRSVIRVADVFRDVHAGASDSSVPGEAEVADVAAIRTAPALPETADELRAMAKVLAADDRSLWLQGKATESNVRRLALSDYRTIAFATHGVLSGELKNVGEPGLILTPPAVGTVADDGYLSSGEVAQLALDADWVILSACNTAAADGTPGAEGLSGLARAFFYAGARSLLVSHWSVASQSTTLLTTAMLTEYARNPAQGKAEAQRKAALALMNTPDHPEYAHPVFWAPFVVVGEGGADVTTGGGNSKSPTDAGAQRPVTRQAVPVD